MAQRQARGSRPSRRGGPRTPIRLRSFQDLLDQLHDKGGLQPEDPAHERWRHLWTGTLRVLQAQEPRAYRRVLAKLERHGLLGAAPDFRRINGRLTAAERITWVSGLLSRDLGRLAIEADDVPPDRRAAIQRAEAALLERLRTYAEDPRPVSPRRSVRCPPRTLLVLAYYGARWKLTQEGDGAPRRRGHSLEDRAIERVAPRFGLTTETARSTIKRTRASLPAVWRTFIRVTPGEMLWGTTMAPDVDVTPSRPAAKGAPKPSRSRAPGGASKP